MDNPARPLAGATAVRPSTTRKRSRSSVEIFNLSNTDYDTKRARIGIQKLSTDSPKPLQPAAFASFLPSIPRPSSSDGPESESQDGEEYSSSGLDGGIDNLDDESTSSSGSCSSSSSCSGDESSGEESHLVGDEGYDSDGESEATTSSSSSSSSSSDGDSDDEDDGSYSSRTATIGFPSPEQARVLVSTSGSNSGIPTSASALTKRLNSLLPQLAAANAQLEDEKEKGVLSDRNIEAVDEDDGRYIEMNLGLGVLEEKHDGASVGSDNDGDESEAGSGKSWTKGRSRKYDAMSHLMGKKNLKKAEIQVVDG